MAKKDAGEKKKDPAEDKKQQQSRGDAVRAAAAQAIEATAGQAGFTRERAQQLADELVSAAGRFRETLEDLRPAGGDEVSPARARRGARGSREEARGGRPLRRHAQAPPAKRSPAKRRRRPPPRPAAPTRGRRQP